MSWNSDEVIGITLGAIPPLPAPVVMRYPIANEIAVHLDMRPNPDNGSDLDDDDVDSLDVVPASEEPTQPICPNWYFSADHEATQIDPNTLLPLDPGDIYEVWPGFGPILVVDDVNNLGVPNSTDVDAFEFVFMTNPDIVPPVNQPSLAVLFSVDDDDSLTAPDESGGLSPNVIYGSFLNGMYFTVADPAAPELDDDIDALTVWTEEIFADPPWVINAVSRKTQNGAPWDINLYPNYDTESRSAELAIVGATSGSMLIEVQFSMPITLLALAGGDVITDTGTIMGVVQVLPDTIQVNMTGVPFDCKMHLWFPGVANAAIPTQINSCSDQLCVGVLVGDYDNLPLGTPRTNYTDYAKVKNAGYINQLVITLDRARADFDCSGRPNYTDFARVRNAGMINKGIVRCP